MDFTGRNISGTQDLHNGAIAEATKASTVAMNCPADSPKQKDCCWRYNSAMRKIAEINSVEVYSRSGIFRHLWPRAYTRRPNTVNQHLHDAWLRAALTPPQFGFIEKRITTFRSHPRHNYTVEVYVDEHQLTESDWTVIHLLF